MRGLEYFNALTSVSLTRTTSVLSLNLWATFSSLVLLSRCFDAWSSKVFAISEIMSLICRFVDRADRVRLMRVSRLLFYCAIPLVWKEVAGAANVIALLSGLVLEERPWERRFYDPEGLEAQIVREQTAYVIMLYWFQL
jgi:hypothetical protein